MTFGQSDGRFLLYGVKFQDGCFDFLSYHFSSCRITVSTSAKKNDNFCAQYADRGVSKLLKRVIFIWRFGKTVTFYKFILLRTKNFQIDFFFLRYALKRLKIYKNFVKL